MGRKQEREAAAAKQRSLIADTDRRSAISEQFRMLRTSLQFASVDKEITSLTITSSSPGEGKSTIVANLAVVLAQQEKRVLIVDADLRKPTVHFSFQVPNSQGLTMVLTKQLPLLEAVLPTSTANVHVLPSGPLPPNPGELLGSAAMKAFLSETAEHFDYVLFDSPPVNAVADSQILAGLTDGTILVVRSGKSEEKPGLQAVTALKKAGANLLGAVLNDRKTGGSGAYYYEEQKDS